MPPHSRLYKKLYSKWTKRHAELVKHRAELAKDIADYEESLPLFMSNAFEYNDRCDHIAYLRRMQRDDVAIMARWWLEDHGISNVHFQWHGNTVGYMDTPRCISPPPKRLKIKVLTMETFD